MITEEQADKIIELLSKIVSNTKDLNYYISDLSSIRSDLEDVKKLLEEKSKK